METLPLSISADFFKGNIFKGGQHLPSVRIILEDIFFGRHAGFLFGNEDMIIFKGAELVYGIANSADAALFINDQIIVHMAVSGVWPKRFPAHCRCGGGLNRPGGMGG